MFWRPGGHQYFCQTLPLFSFLFFVSDVELNPLFAYPNYLHFEKYVVALKNWGLVLWFRYLGGYPRYLSMLGLEKMSKDFATYYRQILLEKYGGH